MQYMSYYNCENRNVCKRLPPPWSNSTKRKHGINKICGAISAPKHVYMWVEQTKSIEFMSTYLGPYSTPLGVLCLARAIDPVLCGCEATQLI